LGRYLRGTKVINSVEKFIGGKKSTYYTVRRKEIGEGGGWET